MKLNKNERIDDLQLNGLKIIQNKEWFCYGVDSVLLSYFASEIHKKSKILDLGSGTGIIGLLLSAKVEESKITCVEVQDDVAEMSKRSVLMNNLENRIEIVNMNAKDFKSNEKFDAVVCNPPYKQKDTGVLSRDDVKLISRHEIKANLEEFICTASSNLRDVGSLYMVNRPERLADIFEYCRKYKLEPKKLRMVYSNANGRPVLVLVKATKYAHKYLKVEKPLYIYEDNGKYTDEVKNIYYKRKGEE